jgi:hypothetical protein
MKYKGFSFILSHSVDSSLLETLDSSYIGITVDIVEEKRGEKLMRKKKNKADFDYFGRGQIFFVFKLYLYLLLIFK